jgi:hypothetical protein
MKSLQLAVFWSFCALACYAQESYLLVSSGGGVAGTATVYKIDKDGKVMKGQGLAEIAYTEESKLKKCATKRYFKGAKAVLKSSPDPAPEDAKKLYNKINTALSRLTFSSGSPNKN